MFKKLCFAFLNSLCLCCSPAYLKIVIMNMKSHFLYPRYIWLLYKTIRVALSAVFFLGSQSFLCNCGYSQRGNRNSLSVLVAELKVGQFTSVVLSVDSLLLVPYIQPKLLSGMTSDGEKDSVRRFCLSGLVNK